MPTLESDTLVFRFPEIDDESQFSISFNRTLRVPDTARTYALPAGLGDFPLRHAEEYAANLPSHVVDRGGIIFPMWQAEAMWLGFDSRTAAWCVSPIGGDLSCAMVTGGWAFRWEQYWAGHRCEWHGG